MMKVKTVLFGLLWCSQVETSQDITVCSEEGNATCVAQGNRVCYINGTELTCGNCLNGYVEFREECLFIDDIDFQLVVDLIDEYRPNFTSTVSNEVRALRLQIVSRIISFVESRIPPLQYQLGLGKYSLDTEEEAKSLLGYNWTEGLEDNFPRFDPEATVSLDGRRRAQERPRRVDWEEFGAMTAVKDQARCGCCWAVSTAASVESAAYLTNSSGFAQSLSFQQMISCDENNLGCNGGNIIYSMGYTWKNGEFADQGVGGLATLNDWPYTDGDGDTTEQCDASGRNASVFLKEPKIVVTVNDDLDFFQRRERMKQAVSIQPIPMVIRAGCSKLYNYRGGVLTDDDGCECGRTGEIDHAVVMVGFNDEVDPPYFKFRNSWNDDWGENGYFRVASNVQGKGEWGLFCILAESVIPLQAFNTSVAEADADTDDDGLQTWAIVVIAIAGALVLCCIGACLCKVFTFKS